MARTTPAMLLFALILGQATDFKPAFANQFVRLDYNLTLNTRARNTVFIELFDDRPLTRDNFMQYVNGGLYDGTIMHRLSQGFVLQGGGFYPHFLVEPAPLNVSLDPTDVVDLDGDFNTSNPTVNNEFANLPFRSNVAGTLAMAKLGGNPNSATNQWFFNLANNGGTSPNGLDFQNGGFTVFAQVVGDGMTTLIPAFGSLGVTNLNPDFNDDGQRDANLPFFISATDAVPFLGSNLVVLDKAARVDYYGTGSSPTLDIPAAGYTIATRDAFFDTGATFTGTGTLTIGAGRTLGVREAININHNVTNAGTIAPGLQNGAITVQSYQQTATGTLAIDIRGTTLDSQYDRLTVSNAAQLNGTLKVSLLNLYSPTPGSSYTVVSSGALTGSFSNFDFPALSDGLVWDVTETATTVTLSIVKADYNGNGVVDAADYVLWRDNYGKTVTAYSGADGNGNGMIDVFDYNVWKANFGKAAGSAIGAGSGSNSLSPSASVPEPAATSLVLATVAFLTGIRRRRAVL